MDLSEPKTTNEPHFLQSETWKQYQELEGHDVFYLKGDDYTTSGITTKTKLGNYLYCAYGPAAKDEKSLKAAVAAMLPLAKEKGAFFIRIEPTLALTQEKIERLADSLDKAHYAVEKSHDLDPAHTWIVPLLENLDDTLAGIEKDKVRVWRNYAKKNISIRTTTDPEEIPAFVKLLQGVARNNNIVAQEEEHLKNQLRAGFATLYFAELEGDGKTIPIAGALVFDYEDTRFAMHAAADYEHRRLKAGAILQVQTIVDAQKAGRKKYDFWGITISDDPKDPWYGFTQYKKTFGGYQLDYTGTYDIILDPKKYRAYKLLRKVNRAKRLILSKRAK